MFTVLLLAIGALKALPYSTCLIAHVDVKDLAARPPRPEFSIGPLHWDVTHYATDTKLDPLREFYHECGGGARGLSAAIRVSRALTSRSPVGSPSKEFFDPSYNPVDMLRAQLAGDPGHCVSRAGTITAVLLSVGIPARVVQILPFNDAGELNLANGHNVLEVWDDRHGWSIVDPMYGGIVGDSNGPCSAEELLRAPASFELIDFDPLWGQFADSNGYFENGLKHGLLLNYPEPWLYVRVGAPSAPAPFRGRYACVGGTSWQLGPAQKGLELIILLTGFGLIGVVSVRLSRRIRSVVRQRASTVGGTLAQSTFSEAPTCATPA
jgi:hypothetical protein